MRIASRIIGVVLALAGLVFVVISLLSLIKFRPESVLEGPQFGRRLAAVMPALFFGLGFLLAGWYFLRLDVNRLDALPNPSRYAPFFVAHRRELKLSALIGLVISLIRAAGIYLGLDWAERWTSGPLALVWVALFIIASQFFKQAGDHWEWEIIPEWMRPFLNPITTAVVAAVLILLMMSEWTQVFHHPASYRVMRSLFPPLIFAWESLFFAYGRLGSDRRIT